MKGLIQKIFKFFGYQIVNIDTLLNVTLSSDEIIKKLCDQKSDLVIFDIGAHIGQSAKKYRKIFEIAEIFSFEPYFKSYETLSSIKIDRFRAYNFGFSNIKSQEKFLVNLRSGTNSLLPFSKDNVWGFKPSDSLATIVCDFDTIDNFCKTNNIELIDFIKIDVQGSEYLVLSGAKETLLNKKIKVIQFEVIIGDTYKGQKSIGFYINFLEKYGYKLKNFSDVVLRDGVLIQTDLFFTR